MRKYLCTVLTIACMSLCHGTIRAQYLSYYVLNLDNGLPSNITYNVLIDDYGYLWIATEKGVVKYNGYTTRIFDKQNGIANDDIWELHLDKKKRIWLSAISNEFGYIYNNTYKKVYNSNTNINSNVYPIFIKQRGDDIIFINKGARTPATLSVDSVHNDTLYSVPVILPIPLILGLDDEGRFYAHTYGGNVEMHYRNHDSTKYPIAQYPKTYSYIDSSFRVSTLFKHYFVSYHNEAGPLYVFNYHDSLLKTVSINPEQGEKIHVFYELAKQFVVVTNKKTVFFDSTMKFIRQYKYTSLFGDAPASEYSPSFFNENAKWKFVMATPKHGVVLLQDTNYFVRGNITSINGATFIGKTLAGYMYWWSKEKKAIFQVDANRKVRVLLAPQLYQLTRVKSIANGKVVIIGNSLYYLDENRLQLTDFYKDIHRYKLDGYSSTDKERVTLIHGSLIDYYEYSEKINYSLDLGSGLSKRIITGDSIYSEVIGLMRPVGLVVDSSRNLLWAYGYRSVFIQDLATGNNTALNPALLDALGITKIQQMLIDRFDNMFIKDNDRLLVFNCRTRTIKKLLGNYRLDDAVIAIHNDRLIVAGGFGVLFTAIQGPMQFSSTVAYRNIKHVNYNYLIGKIAIADDSVFLSTDNGIYKVAIPTVERISNSHTQVNDFNLLLNYQDTIRQLYSNDTIILNHNNLNLQFDVVNPRGYGRLSYMYRMAGSDTWQTLNNNELYLDDIDADTYYDLQLIIKDSEWRSSPICLKVYMAPRWWESYWGRRMVWVGILLAVAGIAWVISYITRRRVNKRNEEKNIQIELKSLKMAVELKSIYAQINPHFIFNTLSTGLYFIKKGMMKEAYTHITTFSDLLRSFLKASRNKYINLAEDIENLENYIKLQQTRFENKFEYRIHVADDVNTRITQIPSLLLQPIVENAIHHGLFHKEGLGHLYISFEKLANEEGFVCTIDDDGIGRLQSKKLKEETTTQTQSYGTDMVKELINILNQNEPILIQLEYIDKQLPDTGTTVIITIKHLAKNV